MDGKRREDDFCLTHTPCLLMTFPSFSSRSLSLSFAPSHVYLSSVFVFTFSDEVLCHMIFTEEISKTLESSPLPQSLVRQFSRLIQRERSRL